MIEQIKEPQQNQKASPELLKKIEFQEGVPVDQYAKNSDNYIVYRDEGKIYATTLNQFHASINNSKFYIIQILKHKTNPNDYIFFTRWGRMGAIGQLASIPQGNPESAIALYNKKYGDKLHSGYQEIKLSYETEEKDQIKKQKIDTNNNDQLPNMKSNFDDLAQNLQELKIKQTQNLTQSNQK